MELTVRKTDLLRELQLFQGIVERKNTIPILANVLIEANGDGKVDLVATDLEVGLRSRCVASVAKGGALTIPAKKLYEIVRALPDTDIRIQSGAKGAVKVAAEKFNSRMQTLPREDFPTLPDATAETRSVTLPRASLREMVGKTQFAITGEDTRYFLNGALFVLGAETMTLVATDGHRLALVSSPRHRAEASGESPGDENAEGEFESILPKKTLWELTRLLSDGEEDVRYTCGENHLFFDVDGRQLISRVIDAQFPAYQRVIPKTNDKTIEFERDRLTSAIKRVALLSSERSRAVKFHIAQGAVDVTSSSPEVGEATETLAVDYDGELVEICFNAQYVLDFLGAAESENVQLAFKDAMSQVVMTPVGSDGCDYTYVIMPMRI
jgi:DNA polymerase-3 subunit beta